MGDLDGKVAWVTGAGSGIGTAAARALGEAGAAIVLTGRRRAPLEAVATALAGAGIRAAVEPGDLTDPTTAGRIVEAVLARFGRLDILVNNAGLNIRERRWDALTPATVDDVIRGNLSAAYYCALAVLTPMRAQQDGVLIHTASWAGKYISPVSGSAYTAAKHAVVAMSQSLNMEEYHHNIRSTAILPAEVATAILDQRPNPPSVEERARMLQPDDLGALVRFVATRPAHICLNEVVISPTANRMYGGA